MSGTGMKDILTITLRFNRGDSLFQKTHLLTLKEIKQSNHKLVGVAADSAWEYLNEAMKNAPKDAPR